MKRIRTHGYSRTGRKPFCRKGYNRRDLSALAKEARRAQYRGVDKHDHSEYHYSHTSSSH